MLTKQLSALAIACVAFAMPSSAQDDDIKQVIIKETDSYFKRDAEAWKSTWLQDPNTSRSFVSTYAYYYTAGCEILRYYLLKTRPTLRSSCAITCKSMDIR